MSGSLGNWLSRLWSPTKIEIHLQSLSRMDSYISIFFVPLGWKTDSILLASRRDMFRAPPVNILSQVRRELFLKTFETRLTSHLYFLTVNRMAGFMSEERGLLYDVFIAYRTCLKNIVPEHLIWRTFFTRQDPQMISVFDTFCECGITIQST